MENKEQIIALNCLYKWAYNFNIEDIEYLKSLCSDFAYVWDNYLEEPARIRHKKEGGFFLIDHMEIIKCFFEKMSYHSQSIVLDYACKKYSEEVKMSVDFMIMVKEKHPNA